MVVGRTFALAGIRWDLVGSSSLAAGMEGSIRGHTASWVVETMERGWLAQVYPTAAYRWAAVAERMHIAGEEKSTPAVAAVAVPG